MPVPNFQQLMLPLLRMTVAQRGETHFGQIEEAIAAELGLTMDDLARTVPSGHRST